MRRRCPKPVEEHAREMHTETAFRWKINSLASRRMSIFLDADMYNNDDAPGYIDKWRQGHATHQDLKPFQSLIAPSPPCFWHLLACRAQPKIP